MVFNVDLHKEDWNYKDKYIFLKMLQSIIENGKEFD